MPMGGMPGGPGLQREKQGFECESWVDAAGAASTLAEQDRRVTTEAATARSR